MQNVMTDARGDTFVIEMQNVAADARFNTFVT